MPLRRVGLSLLLSSSLAMGAPASGTAAATASATAAAPTPAPERLNAQVARLVELLRDSHARGYPEATLAQEIAIGTERRLALAVFTIESFGGGNNHTQFLAVFEHEPGEKAREEHYRLVDVMPIGGKGWRSILQLRAKASQDGKTGQVHLAIPALQNGPEDAANFPSRPALIRLVFDKERLSEPKGR